MCWEMDYLFFAEQENVKKAQIAKEQRAGVIKNLLDKAKKTAESEVEAPHVNEVVLRNSPGGSRRPADLLRSGNRR